MIDLFIGILDGFYSNLSFHNNKNFLTEDDLRCRLFLELETNKNNSDISVNTEIRWFGEDKTLKYRSDIVIIPFNGINEDLEKGSIYTQKGFTFLNYIGIIELKLRRKNIKKSDSEFLREIEKDCQKLIEIKSKTMKAENSKSRFYSIFILDKKGNLLTEIDTLKKKHADIIIYYFSFLLSE